MQQVEMFLKRIWIKAGLREDLDDLTQEALLELLQDLGLEEFERLLCRFEERCVHLYWNDLNSRPILRAIDRVRHRGLRRKKPLSLNEYCVLSPPQQLSLMEVVDRLTKRELCILQHSLDNLTVEQIAAKNGSSVSAVRNLQTKIFKKIKGVA